MQWPTPNKLLNQDAHKCSVEEDVPLKITTYSPDLPPSSIIVLDLYRTYLNSLPPGTSVGTFTVAKESTVLRVIYLDINHQDTVGSIIDPGSEIIATPSTLNSVYCWCVNIGVGRTTTVKLHFN
jgi:hypothetical protein